MREVAVSSLILYGSGGGDNCDDSGGDDRGGANDYSDNHGGVGNWGRGCDDSEDGSEEAEAEASKFKTTKVSTTKSESVGVKASKRGGEAATAESKRDVSDAVADSLSEQPAQSAQPKTKRRGRRGSAAEAVKRAGSAAERMKKKKQHGQQHGEL